MNLKTKGNPENKSKNENIQKKMSIPKGQATVKGKIFVGGVPQSINQEQFNAHWKAMGETSQCILMKRSTEDHHRGFGFVTFKDPTIAEKAQTESQYMGGRQVRIDPCRAQTKQFFVGGLNKEKTEEVNLRSFFEPYGQITDIFVRKARGFAFVTMIDEGSNLRGLVEKQYHELDGVKIEVKYAHPGGIPGGPQMYQHWGQPQQFWGQQELSSPQTTYGNWQQQSYQSQAYSQPPYGHIPYQQNFSQTGQQSYGQQTQQYNREYFTQGKNTLGYNYARSQNQNSRSYKPY